MNGYMLNFETSPLLSWCDANLPHRARHSSSVIDAGCGPPGRERGMEKGKKRWGRDKGSQLHECDSDGFLVPRVRERACLRTLLREGAASYEVVRV